MEPTMELSSEVLDAIGRYVRGNLGSWMRDVTYDRDIEVRERIVRVEEELKAQRELMKQGFEQSEKRFEDMRSYSTRWFTVMSLMLAAIGVAVTVSTFVG
ncbi:MAG: hypothetical protein ACLFNQ_12740 [Spirochaetaceae bacterium]